MFSINSYNHESRVGLSEESPIIDPYKRAIQILAISALTSVDLIVNGVVGYYIFKATKWMPASSIAGLVMGGPIGFGSYSVGALLAKQNLEIPK